MKGIYEDGKIANLPAIGFNCPDGSEVEYDERYENQVEINVDMGVAWEECSNKEYELEDPQYRRIVAVPAIPAPTDGKESATDEGAHGGTKWKRYRFETKAVDDYRPLVFNSKYPWWCSGFKADGSSATIVAFLPKEANLMKYWDDAFNIEFTEHDNISFSDRFPKPSWFI
jgi:hypothetical protein